MVIETYSDNTGTLIWQGKAMYISPDETGWSSMPYTKEQKQWDKERNRDLLFAERIIDFIEKKQRTLQYEYNRIKEGTSTLPKKLQQWFVEHYDDKRTGRGRGITMLPDNYFQKEVDK